MAKSLLTPAQVPRQPLRLDVSIGASSSVWTRGWACVPTGMWLPLLLMAVWVAVVDSGWVQHPLLVPLQRIVLAPWLDPDGRGLWPALGASLLRVSAGVLLGGSLGVALGLWVGLRRRAQQILAPSLHGLRQVTLFAWIPLLTAWFGSGELTKVVFIALSVFFPVLLNTERGAQRIPQGLREVARMHGLGSRTTLRRLTLPASWPSIRTGLELGLMTAWIGAVGAEYAIGSGRGLGAFLAMARDVFRMDLVLAGVLVLGITSYGLGHLALWVLHSERRAAASLSVATAATAALPSVLKKSVP